MQRSWRTFLPLLVLVAVIGYLYLQRHHAPTMPAPPPIAAQPDLGAPAAQNTDSAKTTGNTSPANAASSLPDFLPPEARDTLALIASGGPFPHDRDGVVFGNYEHLLPSEPRGWYHEYTVDTPGAHNRGARRIITGGNPPVVYYYTDDHYRSFHEFKVPR